MDLDKNNGHEVRTAPPPPARLSSPAPAAVPVEPARKNHAWIWILVLIAVGVAGYFIYRRVHQAATAASDRPDPSKRVTPVVVATARTGDMNIYLNGLGSVTPLNTVTVRSRVDGQLMKVAFVEGQVVKAGDPLFEIDPRPFQVQLEQAQGQMAKDQALLNNARRDFERYQTAREAVSQQQVDTAAATVKQYEAAIKVDQATIDSAQLNITYSHIAAPLTGRIGLKVIDQGNIIHANDSGGLAVITQLQPIGVTFTLAEDYVPRVVRKMNAPGAAPLPIDAYDRDYKNKLASGTLLALDSQIDPSSGTVRLKGVFANTDFALFPNQFVNVRLLIDTLKQATLIPSAAVQRSPQSSFVYVVKPDGTVEVRNIVQGPSEGDDVAVESGLEPGETVVTDGVDKLQPGAKVTTGGGGGRGGGPATNRSTSRPAGATTRPSGGGSGGGGNGGRRGGAQ